MSFLKFIYQRYIKGIPEIQVMRYIAFIELIIIALLCYKLVQVPKYEGDVKSDIEYLQILEQYDGG